MQTVMLVLLMTLDLFTCSNGDPFSLVVPDGFISAKMGSSVVLSCGAATTLDIRSYEVRWYRPNEKDNPILLYEDLKVQENAGDAQYRGRASLIGELEKGNVSLKLENLTLADRGEYVCLVKTPSWYDTIGVILSVIVVGSPPLFSLAEAGEKMNVTCSSDGWSPKPTLTWRDKGGRGLRRSVDHITTDSEGLVSVSSWLLFSPVESEWISCSVGLPDQEMKEGRVMLKPATAVSEPRVSPGWKTFIIFLVISLLVFTLLAMFIIPKIRGLIFPGTQQLIPKGQNGLEDQKLTSSVVYIEEQTPLVVPEKMDKETNTEKEIPDWEKMFACKVAIRPDASSTSFLEVGKSQSRVTCPSDVRDKTGFIHALCEERISSGRCYWEITALTEPTKGAAYKCPTSWYVGVTSETAEKKRKVPLTPQSGYWVLHYEREKDSEGLVSVSSWLLFSPSESEWISCSVGLSDQEMREGRVLPLKPATAVLKLVAIRPDASSTSFLEVGKKKSRVTCTSDVRDKTGFIHALCEERISSGRCYWEITALTELTKGAAYKCPTSWYVGVTSETAEKRKVPLTPQSGYWVLHYEREKGYYVNDPSLTPVLSLKQSWLKLSVSSVISASRWTLDLKIILKLLSLSYASVAPHEVMLLLLLIFDLLSCSNADTFSLVVPDGDISGQLGSSVVLPCELSTASDIRSYEVHWNRPDKFDNPILLYKDLKVQENAGDPQYRGRVSLIGDLQKGNVSLELENLTVADRGEYVCYVKSYKWYEKASVFLSLPVVGSPLLLSFTEAGEQVNVTCASDGWSPKPTLTWRDKQGRELTHSVNHDYTDSEGLVSVSSWLLFSPSESEWISCSVGLSDQEMRDSRVLPLKPAHHPATKTDPLTEPGDSTGWKVATILLVISLLVLTVMTIIFFLKFRGHIFQKGAKSTPAEEEARRLVDPEPTHTETRPDKGEQDLSPPSCPAVRETPRTDRATQTSGPETANKETNTEKKKQAGSKTASKKGKQAEKQGRQTANKKTSQDKETQGEVSPPSSPPTNRTDGATQASVPEPETQETSTTVATQGPQAANNNASQDKETQVPEHDTQKTSTGQEIQDSVKNDTESETPDWEKMLSRKVAIKPVPSESNPGVLFKERIRSGQYFWKVNELTRSTEYGPSAKRMFECPKFCELVRLKDLSSSGCTNSLTLNAVASEAELVKALSDLSEQVDSGSVDHPEVLQFQFRLSGSTRISEWTLDLKIILKLLSLSYASVAPHEVMLLPLLMFDLLSCSSADMFSLVVPDGAVSGQLGSSVVLPCAVSSSLDCTNYAVHWYGPNNNDNLILLYKDLKVQENAGDPQYRGRVSLIGDLQKGNISLTLENLTLADRGEYVCFVNSYKWYEQASVFITVPVVGSPPVLSSTEAGEQMNVTCTSGGWSPNITLTWRDEEGRELRNNVDHFKTDSEGLEMKEGRVLPIKPASAGLTAGESGHAHRWTAFIISLVISLLLLVVIAALIFKTRGHSFQKDPESRPVEEETSFLVGPETITQETSTDKETQGELSPLSRPVWAVRTDGATQTSGELNVPSTQVCALREVIRADGASQTSGEVIPPSCPDCALRETNRSDGAAQTSGLRPPACPVCAQREINRTDGATQTSAGLSPPSCPVCAVRETNRTDGATQTSEELNVPSTQVCLRPAACPVCAVKEINRTDGATQTSGLRPPACPVCAQRGVNRTDGAAQTSDLRPPACPVCAVREANRTDGATQTSGPETANTETVTHKETQVDVTPPITDWDERPRFKRKRV
ncbi:hypothetical protein AOLI_G00199380 [Acnodon oligacanthus]